MQIDDTTWQLEPGPTDPLPQDIAKPSLELAQPIALVSPEQTWRRVIIAAAVAVAFIIVIGFVLTYGSAYRIAYEADFGYTVLPLPDGREVRAAHLWPLSLDLVVFVAYIACLALAGRASAGYARMVLAVATAVTVAVQVADGAGVVEEKWVRALIHGWPAAMIAIVLHLLLMIVHALGYLVPPARPARPVRLPLLTRLARRVAQLAADARQVRRALARGDMDRDISSDSTGPAGCDTSRETESDGEADTTSDTGRDASSDTGRDTQSDTEDDTTGDIGDDTASDATGDKPQVNLTIKQQRIADRVIAEDIDADKAARIAKTTKRTIQRWVAARRRQLKETS